MSDKLEVQKKLLIILRNTEDYRTLEVLYHYWTLIIKFQLGYHRIISPESEVSLNNCH